MRRGFLAVVMLSCGVTAASAQTPLSAIDWLSESIKNPPEFEIVPDAAPLVPNVLQDILIKKGLTPVSPDAIGLLSPALTGFSANLWGDMSTSEIVEMLDAFEIGGTPEARVIYSRMLLAQTNPAPDDAQDGAVLLARVAQLMKMGALDAAEALISLAPTKNPAIFEANFEIAILTDRTAAICETLKNTPAISDDLSARVYCLARGGDWNAAAITLSLGGGIGAIEPAREEMLIRFLDPELFENQPDPVAPDPLGAMDFVLREAVVLPRPHSMMPLPYLYRDIGERAPLRAKMEASERLVAAGSLPVNLLFAAYREGKAASSGGVWGRANAVQTLDAALDANNAKDIAMAISGALDTFTDPELFYAFAEEYADDFAKLTYSRAYGDVENVVLDSLHLAGITNITWANNAVLNGNRQLAMAIVTRAPLVQDPANSALLQAVVNGLEGPLPESSTAAVLLKMLEDGREGQAILASLGLLSGGALADPEGVRTALYTLTAAGQSGAARRIAVQILLLPVEG